MTHILVSEGYAGNGVDVRRRVSWDSFPPATQESLHVHAVDPTNVELSTTFFPPGVFIIANHADELSPWTPVISTVKAASGYLSIPCCAWAFDIRYSRERHSEITLPPEDIAKMNLGGEGQTSSYAKYRIWLAAQSVACGWELECDTLRIPSTRNWAIVGALISDLLWDACVDQESPGRRRREDLLAEGLEYASGVIEDVKAKGVFKTRTPEGKAGGH